jgi:hypothetical protein
MTTSPGASGARPSAICQGLILGSAIQFPAWVGGPLPPNGSPSDPTIWPIPEISGAAVATPSTVATSSTTEASSRPRSLSSSLPTSMLLRTIASVPALASPYMSPKPVSIVSPSTSVPDRNATPSTTAELVASRRRLWAPMLRIVVLHMTISSRTP